MKQLFWSIVISSNMFCYWFLYYWFSDYWVFDYQYFDCWFLSYWFFDCWFLYCVISNYLGNRLPSIYSSDSEFSSAVCNNVNAKLACISYNSHKCLSRRQTEILRQNVVSEYVRNFRNISFGQELINSCPTLYNHENGILQFYFIIDQLKLPSKYSYFRYVNQQLLFLTFCLI